MKKVFLVVLLGCGISVLAQAASQPYYFSEKLKNAVVNCTPYSEDIFKKNPDMKKQAESMMSLFFDRLDLSKAKMFFKIQGPQENGCHASIKYDYQLPMSPEYECTLSQKDQNKLIAAMNDKSTEVKTRTFENNGFSMKMTDREFNLVLSEVINSSCKLIEHEPSEDEQKEILHKMMAFSDKFKKSLKTCTPDRDAIEVMGIETYKVTIKGKEKGKCHVASHGFHILLNNNELNLSGFDELIELLSDEKRTTYRPSYKYQGTLFALNKCEQEKKYKQNGVNYSSGEESINLGPNIHIRQGVDSTYEKGICHVLFSLNVERNGKSKDHSLRCDVKESKVLEYIKPYFNLVQRHAPKVLNSGENFSFSMGQKTDDVVKADKELLGKMYKEGICKKVKM